MEFNSGGNTVSIQKKLPVLFAIIVLCILITNNAHHYLRSQKNLLENHDREIALLSQQVSFQVDNATEGSLYVENLIAKELRSASMAIQNVLPPKYEDVTNEQLAKLADELMISHITLLAKTDDDIIGVKSSDPHEINMGTKEWNYWYDAFQQLFALKPVQVEKGLSLPNYWSGPIEIASSNPDHTDKWGYYYDGTTNYIINPYIRDEKVQEYEKRFGPTRVMENVSEQFTDVLELTVFNPKNFGKEDEIVHINGNSFVRLSAQPWYGTYEYHNEKVDTSHIQAALSSNDITSYTDTINGQYIKKTFVPINSDTIEPYVIGITYDFGRIKGQLNNELKSYLYISLLFMIVVVLISFIFSNSITKPIALIVGHVNEIAKGNFGRKLKLNRKDELGNLASNVNALSHDLKTYMDDLKESQELIKFQAYHDPLTTLPNRRFIKEKLDEVLKNASRDNSVLAVIFMDIDRFKHINDSMGHTIGDKLIQMIANRIKENLPDERIIVARQGGDEFIILMIDFSEKEVVQMTRNIINQVKQPYVLEDKEIYVGASCGISFYPRHAQDTDNLIINADIAMYAAKNQGGNKVVIYDSLASQVNKERPYLEAGLRHAIKDELLEVLYQPKINAETGKLIGAEALVRWKDSESTYVPPLTFIPIAEETGLIQPMFELVLKKSLVQVREWNQQLDDEFTVSVNVSPIQFMDAKGLVDSIESALKDSHVSPKLLEIEITESALLNTKTDTIDALERLSQLGIKISVDDFGTGYSSLNYLRKLPIHTLKIDQTFIKDMTKDGQNTEIVEVIINLAHSLKLEVIAEGVEEDYQRNFLLRNGCHLMQGYYFSKPLDGTRFRQLIND